MSPDLQVSRRMRERLLERVARSAALARAFVTVRADRNLPASLVPGVATRALHRAAGERLRPGEPRLAELVELSPGARWAPAQDSALLQTEWLVLRGDLRADGWSLVARDYLVVPAGQRVAEFASEGGVLLYRRAAPIEARAGDATHAVCDADAGWHDYAPGIRRRLLWQRGGEAAMLYLTEPGATVPRHAHRHDEECLMVEGEVFLDDVLLRPGDWQLAPAGTQHGSVDTDTGGVLYAHGDLDLDLIGEP